MPEHICLLPAKHRKGIEEWCHQIPILDFNSGRCDLNLIKEHFAELFSDTTAKVQIGKKGNTTMFMKMSGFRFLDIIIYLGPGTSYDKWVKVYACSYHKSWLLCEWFDSPEKLNYPGLPDYPAWYSRLKGKYVLTLSEFAKCKRTFKQKGRQTFNNPDIVPRLEALEKIEAFYTKKALTS